ncbi:hypothetical protein [Sphingosinicella sp.]|uniref:hypothetical protein n=1 Tax=Sphingosinicella sp. TaxID=1917971 RepID=UPI00403825B9
MRRAIFISVALVLLVGCEMRIGNHAGPVADNASAAGRAENGQFTVEAPGFNLSVTIPEGMNERANVDDDNGLVYPGSAVAGVHVQGRRGQSGGHDSGEVELRLTSADAPDRVAAWYRDPARAENFTVASATRDGEATVIAGTGRRDNERFTLRIAPRAGGGSDMRLLLADGG